MKPTGATRALWSLLYLVAGCHGVTTDTSSPSSVTANPNTVSVEVGKTANVAVTFFNLDHQTLSTAHWLPLSSVSSSDPNVATVAVINNQLVITGQGVGTTTVTVTSSASVKTTITVEVTEPVPVIASVTPQVVVRGQRATIVVRATGLAPAAKLLLNGQDWTATMISPTQLQLSRNELETYILPGNSLELKVYNPPNGPLSNPVIVPVHYPVAQLQSLSPASVPQGYGSDLVIQIDLPRPANDGWNAFPESKVRWDGTDLVTTYVDQFTLRAVVPQGFLAASGSHTITVFNPAPGGGVSNALFFTVTPSVGTATFDFSNYEPQVVWAAQAQGNGAFAQVPVVNKQVQFPVSSGTASLAFVSAVGTAFRSLMIQPERAGLITYQVTVLQMSTAELSAGTIPMGLPFGTTALSGTVSGVGAAQLALLQWGNAAAGATQAQPSFSMTNASAGPHGLVGYLKGSGISAADRVFLRSSQGSGSGVTIDFTGAESAPVATATAGLSGLIAGDQAFGQMGYTTEATCEGNFLYTTPASASFLITGIPGALQGTNDRHLFTFLILNGTSVLSHTINSKALGAFSATRPTLLAAPTVSNVSGAPYQIKQAQVNLGGYNSATLFYSNMSVTATRGFLGGAAGIIKAPDLSGVAGWSAVYAPATTNAWTVGATTTIYPLPGCADGSTRTTVSVSGTNP